MFDNALTVLTTEGYKFGLAILVSAVIITVYKAIIGFLKKKGKELGLEPHILNALRLVVRVVALVVASTSIMTIFGISTDLFVGASALLGAALGFGSSQTINNIVAGFYVLMAQPFKVKDYVKIGDMEGQVEEIAINYTSLYVPTFNVLKVPNTQVMNSRILNLTHEGYIKYTFTISFGHELTEKKVMEKIIDPALENFCTTCSFEDVRRPEAYLEAANRLEKVYLIRLFIPKGKAGELFRLQPLLIQEIMRNFDEVKGTQ